MGKLALFPYTYEMVELCRFSEHLIDFDGIYPIATPSSGLVGKDAGTIDGGEPAGIIISSDLEICINKAVALLLDTGDHKTLKEEYETALRLANKLGKRILVTNRFLREQKGILKNFSQIEILPNSVQYEEDYLEYLYDIPIPTLAILGAGERCNKSTVSMEIFVTLKDMGYQPLIVSSKPYGEIFGAKTYPGFVFDDIMPKEKILRFNHWIRHLVNQNVADILILSIPGTIMKIDPYHFDGFGELALFLSTAIRADLGILSLYANEYTTEYLQELQNLCKYRFNVPIKYIHVANTDMNISPEEMAPAYISINSRQARELALRKSPQTDMMIFSSYNKEDKLKVVDSIIETLSGNR